MKIRKMRNPSKNNIKRLVKAQIRDRNDIQNWMINPLKGLENFRILTRLHLMSKGKISVSSLKGCERYGYKPIKIGSRNFTSDAFRNIIHLLGRGIGKEKYGKDHPLFAPRLKDVPIVVGIDIGRENVNDIAAKSISVIPDFRVYGFEPWHNTLRGDMYQKLLSDINAGRFKLPERSIVDILNEFHNREKDGIEE